MMEVSSESFRSEVLVTDGAHSWRGLLISSQVATVVTLVWWSGSLTGFQVWPMVQPSLRTERLDHWVLRSHKGWRSHSQQCPDGVLIQVSRLVVLGIPGPSRYIPLPQYWCSTWHDCRGWHWLHIRWSSVQNICSYSIYFLKNTNAVWIHFS